MKQLNMNTIRVYAVDPTQDHTTCMQLLQDNGIYVVADLGQPGLSINRDTPAWNTQLYARYTSVVDMFAPYSNVIGFFAGNEVSNNKTNTNASAFVKAAVRDTKAYIKAKNYRQMYVGYATNDDATIRADLEKYFNCGNTSEAIDFWGYNIYSWCGDSSFTESGYDQRVAEFKNYSVPTFFAEYGCNTVQPRKFTEVEAIYGSQMTGVFSGGIVYMYFQEANDYGMCYAYITNIQNTNQALRSCPSLRLQRQQARRFHLLVIANGYHLPHRRSNGILHSIQLSSSLPSSADRCMGSKVLSSPTSSKFSTVLLHGQLPAVRRQVLPG